MISISPQSQIYPTFLGIRTVDPIELRGRMISWPSKGIATWRRSVSGSSGREACAILGKPSVRIAFGAALGKRGSRRTQPEAETLMIAT